MKTIIAFILLAIAGCRYAPAQDLDPNHTVIVTRDRSQVGRKSVWTASREANGMKGWRQHPQDQPLHWQPGVKPPKAKVIPVRSPKHTSLESAVKMKKAESAPHERKTAGP